MLPPSATFIYHWIIIVVKGKFSYSTLLFTTILIPLQPSSKKPITMKKILASLIVFGFAIAMVACGAKKEEAAAEMDTVTTIIEEPVMMDSVDSAMDTTSVN